MESSSEEVGRMLGHVMSVLDHMTSKRVQHLFHMKGSQRSVVGVSLLTCSPMVPPTRTCSPHAHVHMSYRYLQRLSEELLHNLRLSNKAGSQALEAGVRRELANTNITQLQPQHAELVRRTRQLQTQVCTTCATCMYVYVLTDECGNFQTLQEPHCQHYGGNQSNMNILTRIFTPH